MLSLGQATAIHVSNSDGVLAIGDILSEDHIIQGVVCELIDNVIAAVEAKFPVVKDILNGIHLEGDKLKDKSNECMLEWDNDSPINPEAVSGAKIIQEVVNELIDNVIATAEAKDPVVGKTLNALHLEGDKFNGTAHECMLEWDDESAIKPEAASEAEIIQEVVNELVDNATATAEAKDAVLGETLNALHVEDDKFNGTVHECMLEWDDEGAIKPDAASEAEIIQEVVNELDDNVTATAEAKDAVVGETSNVLHIESDKLNGKAHECMLDWDDEAAIKPEAAAEGEIIQEVVNELVDIVTSTAEAKHPVVGEALNALHLEGDKFNSRGHECMLEWDDESAIKPGAAAEAEIIQEVVNELVDNVTAPAQAKHPVVGETLNALHLEGDKFNSRGHECMSEWDDESAIKPEAASEAEIIQEVVNELVDNVTATAEAKDPVVGQTLNALHLEGDRFNGTACECLLEWEDDGAIKPEAASEAEIIQEVVNKLIDDVTATIEAKAPVVGETLNALHLEGDKFNGTAHECMLEWDDESAIKPEAASEAEIIQEVVNELVDNATATAEAKDAVLGETLNALHVEDDKFNGTVHECMLEWDDEGAIKPDAASEAEIIQEVVNELDDNVTATAEAKDAVVGETSNVLHIESDKLNGKAHECMLDWDDEAAIKPEAAAEGEIIQEVVNELVDIVTSTAEAKHPVVGEALNALHLEGDKFNSRGHECMLEWDDESAIKPGAAAEAEIIQEVVNELVDNVTAPAQAKHPVVGETLNALHLEGDKFNSRGHECMSEWDDESAIKPEAASEAEIIQEVVNELVDNVTATAEAKDPVVGQTLNALHLEGDRFNGTACECLLEWEDDGAIKPEAASEAEIIQEVVNKLIDDVTATIEAKAPVVGETLNALHLEGDKFSGTTLEVMLEWDDDGAVQPENASIAEIVKGVVNSLVDHVVKLETQGIPVVLKSFNENSNDIPVEVEKLNGTAHKCTLQWETVCVCKPQTASGFESVNAVTEISFQGDVVSCVAHEFSAAEVKKSAICKSFPAFAIELGSVGGISEIPLQDEIVNFSAQDLTADVRTSGVSEVESVTKAEDIPSAAETTQAVPSELIDVIKLESDDTLVFESVSETLNDIPVEVDKPSSVVYECTLEWEDVSVLEPEREEMFQSVTEVTEIFEQEEVFSDIEHISGPAEVNPRTVKGLHAPELAFESQSVSATTGIPLEVSHSSRTTHESIPVKEDSAFFRDGSNQMDNDKDVSTFSDEVEVEKVKTSNTISSESSLELKSVSEIVQFSLRIKRLWLMKSLLNCDQFMFERPFDGNEITRFRLKERNDHRQLKVLIPTIRDNTLVLFKTGAFINNFIHLLFHSV